MVAVEVTSLEDRAYIGIMRIRGLIARPLAAEARRHARIRARGVSDRVRVEPRQLSEVSPVEARNHSGELSEELVAGIDARRGEDGALVGVEARQHGDPQVAAAAEVVDGEVRDDIAVAAAAALVASTRWQGLDDGLEGPPDRVLVPREDGAGGVEDCFQRQGA